MILKETFTELLRKYTSNDALVGELWREIERCYTGKHRYYHSLTHLRHLLGQLVEARALIQDWETILFSLYYHDVVYRPVKSNNEEKSAELAKQRMQQAGVPASIIARCQAQILATKSHQSSAASDTNYFTDADLSVLGHPWEQYTHYYQGVRKEYAVYPNVVYNAGRRKVLKHFLAMDSLFKTDFFRDQYEAQARLNLKSELALL